MHRFYRHGVLLGEGESVVIKGGRGMSSRPKASIEKAAALIGPIIESARGGSLAHQGGMKRFAFA